MSVFEISISGVISAVLSAIAFLVGMRVAKERADRGVLRELYQELYTHMRKMLDAAKKGSPIGWMSFPIMGDRPVPVVESLDKNGRLNLLPSKLAEDLKKTELDSLVGAVKYEQALVKIAQKISTIVEDHASSTGTPDGVTPCVPVSLRSLIMGEKFPLHRLGAGGENGVSFTVKTDKTRSHYIYASRLKEGKSFASLAQEFDAALANDADIVKVTARMHEIITRLDRLTRLLSSRIKDPNPFSETILQALPDIFRR